MIQQFLKPGEGNIYKKLNIGKYDNNYNFNNPKSGDRIEIQEDAEYLFQGTNKGYRAFTCFRYDSISKVWFSQTSKSPADGTDRQLILTIYDNFEKTQKPISQLELEKLLGMFNENLFLKLRN